MQRLHWPGLSHYNAATRHEIVGNVTNKNVAFVKSYKNFYFYWVLDAGHMVGVSQSCQIIGVLLRLFVNDCKFGVYDIYEG